MPPFARGDDRDRAVVGEPLRCGGGGRGVAEAAGQHMTGAVLARSERQRRSVGRGQHDAGATVDREQIGGRQRQVAVLAEPGELRIVCGGVRGCAVVGPAVGEHHGSRLDCCGHCAGETQHVDHDDDVDDRRQRAQAVRAPVEAIREARLFAELAGPNARTGQLGDHSSITTCPSAGSARAAAAWPA